MLDHRAHLQMFCENAGKEVTLSYDVLKINGLHRIGKSVCGKKCGGHCVMIHERQVAVAGHFAENCSQGAPLLVERDDETVTSQ